MIKRLRKKFIVISIAAVTSVMILLCAGVNIANYISEFSKVNNTLDTLTVNQGRMPEPAEKETPYREHVPGFGQNDRRFEKETPFMTRFFVIRFDENGEILKYNLDKIAAVELDDIDDYAEVAYERGEGRGYEDGYAYKVTKQQGGEYMAVFLDCHREINSAFTLLIVSLCVTAFCIALICIIIILFSKRAMEPVIESDRKQKQFITDASHELKTPITVINTCLSVLEMEVGKQKWIDKAAAQTEKLKNLVNSLVTLAKSDEGRVPDAVRFSISDAVSETIDSFSDFASEQGHTINADTEKGIEMRGDEYAVRQLVSILIDNAVKYASPGSEIHFSMKRHKKGVEIVSSNKCENTDTVDIPHLFDRFYRADKSRNSGTGGFGIGLSVARGICENHKGSISASLKDDSTIVFTAYLSSLK